MAAAPPPDGTFDWHASLRSCEALRDVVLPAAHGLAPSARVLVLGCGDSTLSEDVLAAGGCAEVTSIDTEPRCIAHMRARTAGVAALRWEVLDATHAGGLLAPLGGAAPFDLVLDKGTLDAIVCAGDDAACRAAFNARRALAPGGVLAVVTLHVDSKVRRFLDAPAGPGARGAYALGWASVRATPLRAPPAFSGQALVCVAPSAAEGAEGSAGGWEGDARFDAYARAVAGAAHADETPLLTPQREAELRLAWGMRALGAASPAQARVPLREAHALIFSAAERAEYALEDFEADVAAWRASQRAPDRGASDAGLTADEAVALVHAIE